ncbi:MAG TPA: histidinol dehydrogenase, partial [Candidatus Omnitrophota bacterium]|nr:histidinol dehydrogenase [Candidatus Omnitrophota bacterium]
HVLPTGGTARYFSPLCASTFIKSSQIIHYTETALKAAKEHVQKLTDMEGLFLHRISLEARLVKKPDDAEKEQGS